MPADAHPSGRLSDRHVLITGASSGIGEHLARVAAREGARVTVAARRTDRLAAVVDAIRAEGGDAFAVAMDVADEASVVAGVAAAEAALGPLHTSYANAGIGLPGLALDAPVAEFDQMFAVNVRGAFLTAREAARAMKANGAAGAGRGRIVLIASIGAQQQLPGLSGYCASKAAVVSLGKSLAREWAREGINVNSVCPGYLETEMNSDWFSSPGGEKQIRGFPRRRLMPGDGLDPTLILLGSDEAAPITGGVFIIDDGQSL
ncbi:SDR family NAD(P)-dependent oxidoreductase [Brevundimonas sp.]|uniref:SDR family NAD(P)-dependent oxidoreductase n=1 Tax=Brevundimonas sp. TaxID=1871086 RepID=UPI0025C16298|nr:SDR family oxidoreductase [Brevundimonas sp.]